MEINIQNLESVDEALMKWEKQLIEQETSLDEAAIKIKYKTVAYNIAEQNLAQIEDNLDKFERLVEIFEEKSGVGESCFMDNIERLKEMSMFFEDYEADHAISNDKAQAGEKVSLRELINLYADAFAKQLVYRDIAKREGLIQ